VSADLRPYPEYKDSGTVWVGTIPSHWDCLPHRAVFREIKEQGRVDEPLLSVTISKGIIPQSDLLAGSSKKDSSNLDKSKYKLVTPGDIAYNKMRAWQGAIGSSHHRGIVSPAYIVVRPRASQNPDYFHFLFRTPRFATEAERWSYGITSDQWSLRPEHFKMIYCCVPPRDEQDAIVAFLRAFDGRVRRFIQNRRRLIAVLNEQKQAIINRAVTRGLDPNVRLKPSGIEWLGDIPEHWKLKRFKFVARIGSGQVDPKADPYPDYVLIAPEHIKKGAGEILREETANAQGAISGKYLVKSGEVVYSKIRPALQKAVIAPCDCLCSADMYPLSPKRGEMVADYLLLLLLSLPFTRYVVDCSMRVAMPKVNRDALGNAWLWYPEIEVQNRILRWLSDKVEPILTAVKRAEHEIDLIREYRTRRIADVVTGKVDVRHLAPAVDEALPEDLETLGDADEGVDDDGLEDEEGVLEEAE